MTSNWKVLGTSDEILTCGCCGKTNLKKTVVLTNGEEEVYFGTECAALRMSCKKTDVEKAVRSAAKAAQEEETRQRNIREYEAWQRYNAWLLATYGDTRSDLSRNRAYRAATTN